MKNFFKSLPALTIGIIATSFLSLAASDTVHAQVGYWGDGNQTAGPLQQVPDGHGLTAIGYGSDDHKCIIGIMTAPVENGTINFSQKDTNWRNATCGNGTTGGSKNNNEKYYIAGDGNIITGWTWGADTSGGSPGNDSYPYDECFYQEYTDIATGQAFGWGSQYDGTCNERGYSDGSALKRAVYAPPGRVIIGIKFNIDNDASLKYLEWSVGQAPEALRPEISAYIDTPGNQTASLSYNKSIGAFSPSSKSVTISNIGQPGSSLDCNARASQSWINISNMGCLNILAGQSVLRQIDFNSSSLSALSTGEHSGTITFAADADNSPQTITVNVNVTQNATLSCSPSSQSVNTNQQASLNASGGSGSYSWLASGGSPSSGSGSSFSTSYASSGTKTITVTSGGQSANCTVSVNPPPPPSGLQSCELKANGSTSNLTITAGQSVIWTVSSSPSNQPYFWHVNGGADVAGEVLGKTNWNGPYSYPNAGSYSVYFHAAKDGNHDACPGGKSNTINLNVVPLTQQPQEPVSPCGSIHRNTYLNGVWCGPAPEPVAERSSADHLYLARDSSNWVKVLTGTAPLNNVDLRFAFRGTSFLYAAAVEFDCTNDGSVDRTVSTQGNYSHLTEAEDACSYPSPGTYTVRARGVTGTYYQGETSQCYDHPCIDTATVIVTESFNYSLSNSGTSNVTKLDGDAFTQNTITKTLVSGSSQAINLSLSGVPNGVSYSISNGNCMPDCTSTITFTVSTNAQTGTYPITVTGSSLGRQTTFNLVIAGNPINVTCSANPLTALLGQNITWSASVSGGTPPYTYSWSGTNIPTNPAPNTNPFVISYSTIGTKNASVSVTDANGVVSSCPQSSATINFNPDFQEF